MREMKLSKIVSSIVLVFLLFSTLTTVPQNVSAADAHLDDQGWEWHYDDTSAATKAILTRVVRVDGSTEVNIPTQLVPGINLLSIAASCFYDAEGAKITKILSMPSTVTSIGQSSFRAMTLLTSMKIGSSVNYMGTNVFVGCIALTSIVVPNGVTAILTSTFQSCSALTSVTLGNAVTSLGINAFYGCSKLPSITLPSTLLTIGQTAFQYCSLLTSIIIPNSTTSISDYTFYGCYKLASVTLGTGLTSLLGFNFYNCVALTSITIPNNIVSIGTSTFQGCTALISVTLGSATTSIGISAFQSCTALTSITIPNTVTSLGASAFQSCTALTSIVIPNSVTSIQAATFQSCSALTSATIGSSVTSIGNNAFYGCSKLTSITIPSGVTTIGSSAFQSCTLLTSISFLGLVAPTSVGTNWIYLTPASIRGHAYPASNFPVPGDSFYGLIMGTNLNPPPSFTSSPITGAWEDHAYSYSPTCDQAITTWALETNASWLSQSGTGVVSGTPDNTNSMHSYYVHIHATNTNGNVWQNYTVTVANDIPTFTTTPGTSVWIGKTFYYNASVDDGAYGGTFGSITTNWTGTYSWTSSTGKLYFTPDIKGSFWFNISFNDNSGAANGTIYQNFTVAVAKPYYTSVGFDAWEDHAYSYTPTVNTTVSLWGYTTNGTWINQTPGTGEIYGTPNNTHSMHSYWVNISAATLYDGTIYQNYTIFVNNYIPHMTTTPNTWVYLNNNYYYNASFDDWSLGGTFNGITTNYSSPYTFDTITGKLNFTALVVGVYWFDISFTDNSGAGNETQYQIFYVEVILDTSFTSSPITEAWEDHLYSYTPTVNRAVSSWFLDTNASWLSQNPSTGEVYGTPSNTYSMHSYYVHIKATTTLYGILWQNYTANVVNYIPYFTSTPITLCYLRTTYSYTAAFDDKSVGGAFTGITSNYSLPYSFTLSSGFLTFYVELFGSYWFNITCTDNSGASNATSYQRFTVSIITFSFTSSPITEAWEDHGYSYTPTCNKTVTTWTFNTNASWLSQTSGNGNVHGIPDNTNSMHSYYVNIKATTTSYGWLWQNYTVTVVNYIPHFTSTPDGAIDPDLFTYWYNASFDDETVGGLWVSFTTNLSVSYTYDDGQLEFGATVNGYFWFNISISDNSGAANETGYQNWTVVVLHDTAIFTSTAPTDALECVYFTYTATLDQAMTSWDLTTNASWLAQDALTGRIYGTPSYDVSGDYFSISIEATNWWMTTWQNWTLYIINKAPVFNSTPANTALIENLYLYNAQTDAEYQMGLYNIWTDYIFSYDFNITTGLLMLTAPYIGSFTFEITIDDGSGTANATTTQSWVLIISKSSGGGGAAFLTASFDFIIGADGYTVSFEDTSTNENIVSWIWDFGDGDESSLQNPIHKFKKTGTYQVTMTITDEFGRTAFITLDVITTQNAVDYIIPEQIVFVLPIIFMVVGLLITVLGNKRPTRFAGIATILVAAFLFIGEYI